ncbi:penicillin-binding transpeptidase domain-containing protein [Prosthecobacter sp.]|uniref:peptidoglycan D,D-transpeptidase FtsI family protein n=1 Tax=Prosthecobacter sp. TaxID=1965333 RepID=UPI00248A3E9A|nr:penicillin-binding transpeptidase domain-containing protein [Prosthecobacter sp.]MDI1312237.1 penicillin-binding transpeptidase domain-containing protein [Prosthecobacter sp.]
MRTAPTSPPGSSAGRISLGALAAFGLILAAVPTFSAELPAAAPAQTPKPATAAPAHSAEPPAAFVPGTGSRTDVKPFYFAIPAPRGQILDRKGRPLAQNSLVRRLQFTVPAEKRSTLEAYTTWLQQEIDATKADLPVARMPDAETLKRHYESRRELPVTVSDAFTQDLVIDPQKHAHASLRTEYVRHYPQSGMAAHILGYVSSDGAPPSGPILRSEPLWQRTKGAAGLEAAFNKPLTGTDGTLCLMMADAGSVAYQQVFTPPSAGRDVVTTLNLETQRLAETALAQSKHRCAMVIVDAFTGDIRAMASLPHYDPNAFAGGISFADFTTLTQDIDGPLFDRALLGTYPPGSIFKPIVVLAGLRSGFVDAQMEFECGPSLMIDGREFNNWSKDDHGWFNARAALIRSCNTYFYQSAMVMRDRPILYMAHEFGLGSSPVLPLKTAAGNLPKNAPSNHDLANLSIGQGVTETSPLQMAMVMATLANGSCRPRPRLVTHTQSQTGQLGDVSIPCRDALMPVSQMDLETVRSGMFGVVNHSRGTGKAVRLKKVAVFGKTGTAQWVLRGAKANVVWFAGFVDTNPPLAFAVMVEGNAGESGLSGGGTAAPIIAKVLHDIEDRPTAHDVKYEPNTVPEENDPLTPDFSQPPPGYYGGGAPAQYREQPGIGGFFQRLFR